MDLKLEVYNQSLVLQGLLEVCKSIVWTEEAYGAGSFQLESILTDDTRALLEEENIIWIADDVAGIIEHIETSHDETGTAITAKGRLLTSILDRRILWGTYNLYDTPSAIMYTLVTDCCISPTRGTTAYRTIDILELGDEPSGGSSMRKQATGGQLLEVISEIGDAKNVAFKVAFDAESSKAVFTAWYGTDRSINQSDVDPVFFSTELDDVLASRYLYDSSEYRTAAYIGGQVDDDTDTRTYATVEGSESGLNRRELFVDARDLSQSLDDTTLSDSEYEAVLQTRGSEKLAEHQISQNFEVSIKTSDPTYEYGTDFVLGDTITLIDEQLGLSVDAIVTAVQRSVTREGEALEFTFGYDVPTVYDIIKRR